jgi:predicted GNAT family acetyltransferase
MSTTVAIRHQPSDSEFVLDREGRRLGYLAYSLSQDKVLTIDYVEVDRSLRGSGMGNRLVDAAVAWARENDLTVKARCSFARAVLAASHQ